MSEKPKEAAEAGAEVVPAKGMSGKKLVLFIVLPLLLVLGGGGAAAYFLLFSGDKDAEHAEKAPEPPKQLVFFDLPDLLVNLSSSGKQSNFLKLKVALEIEDAKNLPQIEKMVPRIVDNFQVYLRELRIDDLRGSAGVYRLKEELIARVNKAVEPTKVSDVLFKEMLIQ